MEGIWLVLFVIMIVVSLIEQANKAGKRPGQRPPPRVPPGRWPDAELPPGRSRPPLDARPDPAHGDAEPGALPDSGGASDRSAADMVAEDFWRELTGLPPRPQPTPVPPPSPEASPVEARSLEDQAVRQVEAPPPETAPRRESPSWEYRRPEVKHEAPVVVSLEEPVQPPEVRRAAFGKRLAAQAAAQAQSAATARAARAEATAAAESPLVRRIRSGEGLRESVIMAEVFGRPRGLEEYSPDR